MGSSFSFFISVPPLTSTSSTHTMPPRAFSSYLILHTISGSLSMLRSFILRSIRLLSISVSGDTSPARSNTVAVHDPTTPRPSLQDLSAALHTIYGYLTGLLLTLTTLKYQGSSTNPFSEHPTLMMLFLVAIFVYVIALIAFRSNNHMRDHSAKLMLCVCHISGALACELLLLVLVSPMRSLFINVSSLAVIVMWVLCYKYMLHLFHAEGTEEPASHQMADLEAASTISTAYP